MNQGVVIDCSVAMSWCFSDERTGKSEKLLHSLADTTAIVPALWHIELTNVLYIAEQKGRITIDKVAEFMALIEGLEIELDFEGPLRAFSHLLPLCRAHRLTSYDAMYLDLALRRNCPLATTDTPLQKAAKKVNVQLVAL